LVEFSTAKAENAKKYGVVSHYTVDMMNKLYSHICASFNRKLDVYFQRFNTILSRVQSSVQVAKESINRQKGLIDPDAINSVPKFNQELEELTKHRSEFAKKQAMLLGKVKSDVLSGYRSGLAPQKQALRDFAEKLPSASRSAEYSQYINSMLTRELTLMLDKLDNKNTMFQDLVQGIVMDAEKLDEATDKLASKFEEQLKKKAQTVKKVSNGLQLVSGLASAALQIPFNNAAGIGGAVASMVIAGGQSLIIKQIHHKCDEQKKQLIDEFMFRLDHHVEQIANEKFQKIQGVIDATLKNVDDEMRHRSDVIAKAERSQVLSKFSQEYFGHFFEALYILQKTADVYHCHFISEKH